MTSANLYAYFYSMDDLIVQSIEYARRLSPKLVIPCDILSGFIFIFVRAAVHYALFEDEYYLKMQMKALKISVFSILNQNKKEN